MVATDKMCAELRNTRTVLQRRENQHTKGKKTPLIYISGIYLAMGTEKPNGHNLENSILLNPAILQKQTLVYDSTVLNITVAAQILMFPSLTGFL